jgi:hypothetical protein
MEWLLPLLFLAGWFVGVLAEYFLHWLMHARPLHFHLHHHKEFFVLAPREVAHNTLDIRMNLKFFAALLILASPLMWLWGWGPVLCAWGGAFWHLVFFYEGCHGLIHYDAFLPRFVRGARPYRWWKGCHFEHHTHSPTGNYCITFPMLDWCFGTYIHPRKDYSELEREVAAREA